MELENINPPRLEEEEEEDEPGGQAEFFQAAETGDVTTLKALIDQRNELGIDLNGKNEQGYSALQLAVLEGYIVIIQVLLSMDVVIGDALLRAVDVEFEPAVECILKYVDEKGKDERDKIINCHCDGSDFHPTVTPIMRAAQINNFALVKLLLDRGARITERKHASSSDVNADSLLQSVGLVEQYKGIATPAYVTQAYPDPIEKAFQLTRELTRISYAEVENKLVFQEMAEKMEQLAADLISLARNTSEILKVLKYSESGKKKKKKKTGNQSNQGETFLPKISRAIEFRQKRFVAGPNCQQSVGVQFRRQLAGVTDWPAIVQILLMLGIILAHPILCILYKVGVFKNVRQFVETPYIKFLIYLGSDILLLGILIVRTFFQDVSFNVFVFEISLLLLFSLGIGVRMCRMLYFRGPRIFFTSFDNYRDMLIAILLLMHCVFECLRLSELGAANTAGETPPAVVDRAWNDYSVLSRTIFSLVNVIAFLRIMPYLTASDFIGALQISLGDMIVNTAHFFVYLFCFFVAFGTGMTFLYRGTPSGSREVACLGQTPEDCAATQVPYTNIFFTMLTLYWSLFGMIDVEVNELPENQIKNVAGLLLFGLFHIFAIIVLLNALIAIMSNVFNEIEENADVEWKYSRTVLWMSFMDDQFIVPPPFNIIPDARKIYYRVRACCRLCRRKSQAKDSPQVEANGNVHDNENNPEVNEAEYQAVIKMLMERYVTEQLSSEQSATGGIGPLDIRDLRNDVATLRFDVAAKLREIEEDITREGRVGNGIHTQSVKTSKVFDRTLEINTMVDGYSNALTAISGNVDEYNKECTPGLGGLNRLIDHKRELEALVKSQAAALEAAAREAAARDIAAKEAAAREAALREVIAREAALREADAANMDAAAREAADREAAAREAAARDAAAREAALREAIAREAALREAADRDAAAREAALKEAAAREAAAREAAAREAAAKEAAAREAADRDAAAREAAAKEAAAREAAAREAAAREAAAREAAAREAALKEAAAREGAAREAAAREAAAREAAAREVAAREAAAREAAAREAAAREAAARDAAAREAAARDAAAKEAADREAAGKHRAVRPKSGVVLSLVAQYEKESKQTSAPWKEKEEDGLIQTVINWVKSKGANATEIAKKDKAADKKEEEEEDKMKEEEDEGVKKRQGEEQKLEEEEKLKEGNVKEEDQKVQEEIEEIEKEDEEMEEEEEKVGIKEEEEEQQQQQVVKSIKEEGEEEEEEERWVMAEVVEGEEGKEGEVEKEEGEVREEKGEEEDEGLIDSMVNWVKKRRANATGLDEKDRVSEKEEREEEEDDREEGEIDEIKEEEKEDGVIDSIVKWSKKKRADATGLDAKNKAAENLRGEEEEVVGAKGGGGGGGEKEVKGEEELEEEKREGEGEEEGLLDTMINWMKTKGGNARGEST